MGIEEIRRMVAEAEARVERAPGSVRVLAISKVQPEHRVRAVLEAGHRLFGENRVQEAEARWEPLRDQYPDVELHLVGPLQGNKVRRAVEFFDAIHSVDRDRLARRIADAAQELGRCPALFVQVNTGSEPQKAGVEPAGLPALLAACREYGLAVEGLMCIPPAEDDPRPHFRALREMAEREGLAGLSMGMSDDFEEAIAEGATIVRIGSAIFGARESPAQR